MNYNLTANFTWQEVACKRTGLVRLTTRFWRHMELLQQLRDWWGGPLGCSGYRSPLHNARVGGVGDSQHLLFSETTPDQDDRFATDIHPLTLQHGARDARDAIGKLADKAIELGFTGIGMYNQGLHLDLRLAPTTWDQRTPVV